MKRLILKGICVSFGMTIGAGLILFGNSEGWAEEKHKISYKWPGEYVNKLGSNLHI